MMFKTGRAFSDPSDHEQGPGPFPLMYLGLYAVIGFLCYSTVVGSFFLSDDFVLLHAVSQRGPFGIWSGTDSGFFRPVTSAVTWLDYKIWHLNPVGYHLTNILIHSACAFMLSSIVFFLALGGAVPRGRETLPAVFAGLFFLVLATHSESVSWISGRTDLVAALFSLGSLWAYLAYKRTGGGMCLALSALLAALALLSKECAIGLPVVILAFELYFRMRDGAKGPGILPLGALPHLAALLLYLLARHWMVGTMIGGYGTSLHMRLRLKTLLMFLHPPFRTFVPALGGVSIGGYRVPVNATLLPVFVAALVFFFRRCAARRIPGVCCLLIVVSLLSLIPMLNLGVSPFDTQGERFLYLPSAFFVAFLILALRSVLNRRRFLVLCSFLILIQPGFLYRSNRNWKQAGEISRSVVAEMERAAGVENLFILNLPDNIRGAYILRKGVSSACALFCGSGGPENVVAALHHPVCAVEDAVSIERGPDGIYSLRFAHGVVPVPAVRGPAGERLLGETFDLFELAPGEARLKPVDSLLSSKNRWFFYTAGTLRPID